MCDNQALGGTPGVAHPAMALNTLLHEGKRRV
jgi:hypothetical protein